MFSYEFYKVLHLTSLILLFSGLTTLVALKAAGVTIEGPSKKFAFISHGLGLVLVLVSGFGLLARLGLVQSTPNWVLVKIAVWLFLGGIVAVIKRKGATLKWFLYLPIITAFVVAAYMAVAKPF